MPTNLLPSGLLKTWVVMVIGDGQTYPLTLSLVLPLDQTRSGCWDGSAEEEEEEQDLRWASNLVFSLSSSMILCSRVPQSWFEVLPPQGHPEKWSWDKNLKKSNGKYMRFNILYMRYISPLLAPAWNPTLRQAMPGSVRFGLGGKVLVLGWVGQETPTQASFL